MEISCRVTASIFISAYRRLGRRRAVAPFFVPFREQETPVSLGIALVSHRRQTATKRVDKLVPVALLDGGGFLAIGLVCFPAIDIRRHRDSSLGVVFRTLPRF